MDCKRFVFIIALAVISLPVFAQTKAVKLISLQQLEKRISNPDTVYVVNFWATWCGPCVAELPNFDKLQQTFTCKPLKVLLVSMDFKSKLNTDLIPFIKNRKTISEVFLANKTSEQAFINGIDKSWSGALPATLIVNHKRNIRKFYEQELTYAELSELYLTNNN